MTRRSPLERLRVGAFVLVGVALAAAVWTQRDTIGAALSELRTMSAAVIAALVLVAISERVLRADILRRLLDRPSFAQALTIHDVGSAASKGIPFGGPIATGLRWSIARDADVAPTQFVSAMVGYGVAATFATWLLPFGVLAVQLTQTSATTTDLAMFAVCTAVLVGSVLFWAVVLGSDRVTAFVVRQLRRVGRRIEHRVSRLQGHDPAGWFLEIRTTLLGIARRPGGLLVRTAAAQACGAVILLIALRELGVGAELGTLEFARVYFVVMLVSSFVPVPGGVGVVEAGLTGALVAAGVASGPALAAVLVFRLLTYVAPIMLGAALYGLWRVGSHREPNCGTAAQSNRLPEVNSRVAAPPHLPIPDGQR